MKIKIEPSKKSAPKVLPYICALLYVTIAGLLFIGLGTHDLIYLVPSAIILIILVFWNYHYSWYYSAEFRKSNNFFVYEVENIIGVLGHNKSRYDIHSVEKLTKNKKYLLVYGNIMANEPMSRTKEVSMIKIDDAPFEVVEILSSFMNSKEK